MPRESFMSTQFEHPVWTPVTCQFHPSSQLNLKFSSLRIMDLHFDIQDHLRLGDIEAMTNSLIKAGSLVLSRMPSAENPEDEDVK